jgi:hypothetical protein
VQYGLVTNFFWSLGVWSLISYSPLNGVDQFHDRLRAWQRKEKKIIFFCHVHIHHFAFSVVDLHCFVEHESSLETVKGVMKRKKKILIPPPNCLCHDQFMQSDYKTTCVVIIALLPNMPSLMRTEQTMTSSLFATSCDNNRLWRPYLWWGFISVQASVSMRGRALGKSSGGASVFRLE